MKDERTDLIFEPGEPTDATGRVAQAVMDFLIRIPKAESDQATHPAAASRERANRCARQAAMAAGSLALPAGPLGWLTILPEMMTVWRLQSQMVADIAGIYGRELTLSREQMMYCLFRHTAAHAVRDLVVRVGERTLVRSASVAVLQRAAKLVGHSLTRSMIRKGVSRWVPLVGAVGVGAYAYYDTLQVARTAVELFEREVIVDPDPVLMDA